MHNKQDRQSLLAVGRRHIPVDQFWDRYNPVDAMGLHVVGSTSHADMILSALNTSTASCLVAGKAQEMEVVKALVTGVDLEPMLVWKMVWKLEM